MGGYQWVANAATDSNCAASTDHVNTLTAYHEQLIGTSGTYGLCYANLNSNAATYVSSDVLTATNPASALSKDITSIVNVARGYLWVYGATNDATCAAAATTVLHPVYNFTRT